MPDRKKRVLVIDDEADLLQPIAAAFRASGIEVEILASSVMAESLLARGLGVQGLLVKPFHSAELVTRVTALFAAAG
jgi:DNA-binding response OmpR family regulator